MALRPAAIYTGLCMCHCQFSPLRSPCLSDRFPRSDRRKVRGDGRRWQRLEAKVQNVLCMTINWKQRNYANISTFHLIHRAAFPLFHPPIHPFFPICCTGTLGDKIEIWWESKHTFDSLHGFGRTRRRKGCSCIGIDWSIILCIVARLLH